MDHPTYTYDTNEFREAWDKQAREIKIVKRDSDLIGCMTRKADVQAYAQSRGISEDLVIAVWGGKRV